MAVGDEMRPTSMVERVERRIFGFLPREVRGEIFLL
jgi:hypothetical protein